MARSEHRLLVSLAVFGPKKNYVPDSSKTANLEIGYRVIKLKLLFTLNMTSREKYFGPSKYCFKIENFRPDRSNYINQSKLF